MFGRKKIDLQEFANATGCYLCAQCGNQLFEKDSQFNAGCGFPSFWKHWGEGVRLNPLDTYGRHRIQLVCSRCGQHLGHLFNHPDTPTGLRYCISEKTIRPVDC